MEASNDAISEEWGKGTGGLPVCLRYLLDWDLADLLDQPKFHKQSWLRAVEAAQGRVPTKILGHDNGPQNEDAIYKLSRKFLRQWMANGRY